MKAVLANPYVAHADETGGNVYGEKIWLHCFSNVELTWFAPH